MSEPVDTSSPFSMTSPVDGHALPAVEATAPGAVQGLVERARAAQIGWAEKDISARAKALAKLGPRILKRADEIARVVHEETGKPEVEALLGEVLASADLVAHWCAAAEELFEPTEVELDALSYPRKFGFIHREARGTLGVIMPWNFPFALPLRTLVPALLSGDAVVFKPSEITPRTGALIRELLGDLVAPDLFALAQGGPDVGVALCSAEVDAVIFTGSPRAGREVARACAERLIPCSLELGGKDAALVLADANLERAANGIVWASMMNAGQNCGAVERVYVLESVAGPFIDRVVALVGSLEAGRDYGPLTTRAQLRIVASHVDEAREKGAKVLAGGEARGPGSGFAPTVLQVDTDDLAVIRDETFGPVLPIRVVKDEDEAVRLANASRYGLTASVWTRNTVKGERLARKLKAGVVTINNHSFTGAIPGAPWSGVGESGYGVTNSHFALDMLTRPRFVLVDENKARRELYWYPYTPVLRKVALALISVRGGARSLGARIAAIFTLLVALPKRLFGG